MEIRANSVLPARRENVELRTADGLRLVGELALPERRDPAATLICLHPLPAAGGSMDAHLLAKAANRLPELARVAVLRFNTRGTSSPRGTSEGTFDGGAAERHDVAAAVAYAESAGLPVPWLLGWSFGAGLALRWGRDPAVAGVILLAPPPPGDSELVAWAESAKPMLVLAPELDEALPPGRARAAFAALPGAEVVGVAGAGHGWAGEPYVRIALNEIVRRIAPASCPLPQEHPAA